MASVPVPYISLQDYIEGEERSEVLHEYYLGEVFPMEAATLRHQDIAGEIFGALKVQLKDKPCRVRFHGARVCTGPDGLYAYPDIVVCGSTQVSRDDPNAIANPKVIVEVLSSSTKDYDRGTKFDLYATNPTLTEYVAVHQDQAFIEHRIKQSDGSWLLRFLRGMESTLQLETLPVSIPFSAIYPPAD